MKIKLSELKKIIKEEAALNEKHWGSYRRSAGEGVNELTEDTFDKEIENLKKNIKNDEEHVEDLKKDIEGNKEELDRAEKRNDAEEVLDERHQGSEGHEYRRRGGHRAGEGPEGHYKDDEGTWGEGEDEDSREHPGEEDYTGHKRNRSKTDPGEEDYTWRKHESYRATAQQLRGIIEEEMKALLDKE